MSLSNLKPHVPECDEILDTQGQQKRVNSIHESDKRSLRAQLVTLPIVIYQKQTHLIQSKSELEVLKLRLKTIELSERIAVENVIDPETSKPLHKNEKQRDHALWLKLGDDVEYTTLVSQVDALEKDVKQQLLTLEFINNTFSGLRAAARLSGD